MEFPIFKGQSFHRRDCRSMEGADLDEARVDGAVHDPVLACKSSRHISWHFGKVKLSELCFTEGK
jgi:hypothetical protein